jgi:hypothetical protein
MIRSLKGLKIFTAMVMGAAVSGAMVPNAAIAQEFSGSSDDSAQSQSPLTGATDAQREKLDTLDMGIIVPSYMPEGFKVVGVTTRPCAPSGCGRGLPEYSIVYRSPSKACFSIEGTSGGLGGPSLDRALPVNNELLGATEVGFYRNNDLASDWQSMNAESGPYYRLSSRPDSTYGCTTKITQKEAIKVVRSLVLLY